MRDFVLMTDSCCDMTPQMAEELGLIVLPLSLELGGATYHNYLDGREIGFSDFYSRIRSGETATTSAISVGTFEEAMRPVLESGRDILCLSFSSALSTTYQSAVIAAGEMREAFPEAKVHVVDTLCASLGQGLLVYLCALQKQAGKSLEELRDYAENTKGRICHWFTVDDLNHLKRGGRVSAATALFGTMLSIKPVLHVDDQGRLIPVSKARGRRASLLALVENLQRKDLDFWEESLALDKLISTYHLSQEEAARRIGKSQSAVANKLRLLKLPREVLEILRDGGATERHARALLCLEDAQLQLQAAQTVVEQHLTVAQTEALTETLLLPPPPDQPARRPRRTFVVKDVRLFLNTVQRGLTLMRTAGVNAQCQREDGEEEILLTIRIPRSPARG